MKHVILLRNIVHLVPLHMATETTSFIKLRSFVIQWHINRVPVSAAVTAGTSPLSGSGQNCVIPEYTPIYVVLRDDVDLCSGLVMADVGLDVYIKFGDSSCATRAHIVMDNKQH